MRALVLCRVDATFDTKKRNIFSLEQAAARFTFGDLSEVKDGNESLGHGDTWTRVWEGV